MAACQKVHEHPLTKLLQKRNEGAVCEYIDRLDKFNMCVCPQMIVGAAHYLIRLENCVAVHFP